MMDGAERRRRCRTRLANRRVGDEAETVRHNGRSRTMSRLASSGTIEVMLAVDRSIELWKALGGLAGSEHEVSTSSQCEVQQIEDPLLCVAVQIDEEIAARDEIELRE